MMRESSGNISPKVKPKTVIAAMAAKGTDGSESATAGHPKADTKITAVAVG